MTRPPRSREWRDDSREGVDVNFTVTDELCQELEANGVEHEHRTDMPLCDMPLCYKLAARIEGWTRS
jgi:hypothetical protein